MKGEREHIGLADDKTWVDTQWFKGWGGSMGPQSVYLRRAGDTVAQSKSCRHKLGAPQVVGPNKEASVKHLKGNKGCSSMKVTRLKAQMKWCYTNTHSMGNKQEDLEATMLLESYDLIALIETWWDESHDWSVAIYGYRLFRRDRQGKSGGGIALYIKKSMQWEELSLKNSHE